MTIAPVIERELRLALRKKNSTKSRFNYAAIGVGLAVLCLIIQAVTWSRTAVLALHSWMFYLGLYIAFFKTHELAADLFVEERQSETMGLLYLAGVTMQDLFGGKLLAAFLVSATNLLALAPCMAIPFLTGGISISLFLATVFCLPTMLVFTLSVVCLGSVVWKDESTARVGSMVITAVLSLLPIGAYELCAFSSHPISPLWRVISPAWGPWLIHREHLTLSYNEFWLNAAITLAWALLFFTAAGLLMRHFWKRELSGKAGQSWFDRTLNWVEGSLDWRRKKRSWLDRNPFVYKALSDRQPTRLAWGVIAIIIGGATLCCLVMPNQWIKVWIFFAVAILMQLAVEWIVSFTAAKRLADDRRKNAYELLLTTPMGVHELIDGQVIALSLQFRPIFICIFAINTAMIIAGVFIHSWNWRSAVSYILVWLGIMALAGRHIWGKPFRGHKNLMWAGLNTGLPSLAVAKCWGYRSWTFFYHVWIVGGFFLQHGDFPTGSVMELIIIVGFSVAICASLLSYRTNDFIYEIEQMLVDDFRLIAAEPMPDPKDPRLKKWQPRERLYHYRNQMLDPITASATK